MKAIKILGTMSGTSLDGLDLCLVSFEHKNDVWEYNILKSGTIKYTDKWLKKLSQATHLNGEKLLKMDIEYGIYLSSKINEFLDQTVDFIASHGHTVYHQPECKMTLQIGNGNEIYAGTNIPVINDFRSLDIALGGQGAPLVPIGDKYLFPEFIACINFGGIANISYDKNSDRIAFDICPVNMAFNYLAEKLGFTFDDKGENAKKGEVNSQLLADLNALIFYEISGPKSLGVEWFNSEIIPLLENNKLSIYDQLRTFAEHVSIQVSKVINTLEKGNVLITGGGAYNTYLIESIQKKVNHELVIPENEIIEYKEALIFAFLGLLRSKNKINVLKSVTGAKINSSSGTMIGF